MKFLIISALLFSAYISLSYAATPEEQRDQLLRRARYLTTLVEGEVKILRVEGHTLQAEGLQRELEQLLELELELRVTEIANVTQTLIQRLDNNLNALETRIQTQLNALGRQFVTRQEIQRLINRTQDLIRIVSQEVKVLRAANRTLLATGLEAEEQRLIQLEVNLRSTQNPQEIRRLEELLVEADYRVWEILNGLNATRRALKDDVLKRADELINVTNDAIKAFQAEGNRTNVVALLNRTEREIRRVEEQLRSATNESVVRRLEDELLVLEFELSRDLSRFGKPITLQERRDLLVTAAQVLQQRANVTIVDLQRNNRSADVTTLQNQLRNISALVDQLSKATTDADLTRLEASVRDAERALFEELQRLNRDPADPREVQRLLRRAEELAARVVAEIRTLIQQNRSLEAEGLRAEEQELILLDVELRDASTRQDIVRLEQRLVRAEERVAQELRALNRTKRALKDDVVKRAQELIAIAEEAITAFKAQNRTQAVQLIQRAEQQLQQAVTQLNSTTNATLIEQIQARVVRLEFELADDLRRLGRPIDVNERRDLLLTAAEELARLANAEINNLRAANRSNAIAAVEAEQRAIVAIVQQLRNATNVTQLTNLENQLAAAERRLAEELRRVEQPVITREERDALLRRAEELAIRIIIEIRKLRDEGRILLAEGLYEEERHLIHLDAQIRTAVTPQEIARLESRLKEEEDHLSAELARLGA